MMRAKLGIICQFGHCRFNHRRCLGKTAHWKITFEEYSIRFERVLVADINGFFLAKIGCELFGIRDKRHSWRWPLMVFIRDLRFGSEHSRQHSLSLPINNLLFRLHLTNLVDLHGEANSEKDAPLHLLTAI